MSQSPMFCSVRFLPLNGATPLLALMPSTRPDVFQLSAMAHAGIVHAVSLLASMQFAAAPMVLSSTTHVPAAATAAAASRAAARNAAPCIVASAAVAAAAAYTPRGR